MRDQTEFGHEGEVSAFGVETFGRSWCTGRETVTARYRLVNQTSVGQFGLSAYLLGRYASESNLEDSGMRFRIHVAAFVTALAMCGATFGQTKPETSVRKLRNITAADAAVALNAFIEKEKLPVAVVTEPVTNSVVLAGGAAPIRQVADQLASLDKEPQQILAEFIVLEAPVGFAEDIGLCEEKETNCVLTPRETRMLTAALRLGKGQNGVEVLSEPQVTVPNNNTADFRAGNTEADKVTARLTPRIESDGNVKLGIDVQRTIAGKADEKIQANAKVADGGTFVFRGAKKKVADRGIRETLVVVTVHVLRTAGDGPRREVLALPRVPTIGVSTRE